MLTAIYTTILYQPLYNILIFLYNIIPGQDVGIAIIALTVLIKLLLYPLSRKSIKSQKDLQELQPKIDQLKEQYKDDREKMAGEMMKLYKESKVSPFSSCLPLLIQLPFFIAVYQVFRSGLTSESFDLLYSFVANPNQINHIFLGLIDLSRPNVVLALLAGAGQFFQTKMYTRRKPEQKSTGSKDENMMAMMNKQMLYVMPIFTVVIGFSLPGGLTLYWLVTTLLMIFQQY
ncbi:MAG TPA: YidC/Oxa1 family membrane protein insertase, partial [Patescibacteria group bacterium]